MAQNTRLSACGLMQKQEPSMKEPEIKEWPLIGSQKIHVISKTCILLLKIYVVISTLQ